MRLFQVVGIENSHQHDQHGRSESPIKSSSREHGHGETKATCLWLKNLPRLQPINCVEGREQNIIKMGQALTAGKSTWTYLEVAAAMGDQWGNRVLPPVAEQLSLLS